MRKSPFVVDDRAIEGLPIRLVIALVVGVASLSVMMSMLSGLHGLAVTELDTKPSPEVVEPGSNEVKVTVVDPEGEPIAGATVVARGETARIGGIQTGKTNANGVVTFDIDAELAQNQADGTVAFEIKPPAGGEYVDRRENTAVLVVRK